MQGGQGFKPVNYENILITGGAGFIGSNLAVGLKNKYNESADNLPLGERKILEIGRALATQPELVCLDDPASGLNETETEMASSLIKTIREKGITVLLVEHDMKVVMNISDEIMVLNYGQKIAEGTPQEIQNNPR